MIHTLEHTTPTGILDMLGRYEPPCLTLYQPTHRRHPENQQDPIRFRNLIKLLEESLQENYPDHKTQPLLEPFLDLAEDDSFWNHTLDGLAVLSANGLFRVYKLQRSVAELVVAADTFHTTPLLRLLQSSDRYQILGLNRHEIKFYEGNRDTLDEIALNPAIAATITDALGDELTDSHQTVASYGGIGGGQSPMYHGHGSKESEVEGDAERFFRSVDRDVLEHHSRPSGLPLILATLPEHRQMFQQVSHNPSLMLEGIDIYPDTLSLDELRERAWQVFEPHYRAKLATLAEAFGQAKAKNLGQDNLADVAVATAMGRVATLLIEADREILGRLDTTTGDIELDELAANDLLNDLGMLARQMGGEVVIVSTAHMPTQTGVAAIYRY
ncbi:MAG: hypothetical protein OT477_15080 [Chloroflexi bacterium]|nr:hypothetical protein [Chloroflexota bacterium]